MNFFYNLHNYTLLLIFSEMLLSIKSFGKIIRFLHSSRHISTTFKSKYEITSTIKNRLSYPTNTGIAAFEKNIQRRQNRSQGKHLPSWVENNRVLTQEELDSLYKAFPAIVHDVVNLECAKRLPNACQRMCHYMEYEVPWIPHTGVQLLMADKFYLENSKYKANIKDMDEHRELVHKLAWAMETVARAGYQTDDIMDCSKERNGRAGWYTLPDVGPLAFHDICAMLGLGHILLHKYFSHKEYYSKLHKLASESTYLTEMAEAELSHTLKTVKHEYSKYKSGAASPVTKAGIEANLTVAKGVVNATVLINLGMACGMVMHGMTDPVKQNLAFKTGEDVIKYAIIVDDYIDYFGNFWVNERETTDLEEGKLTWLFWKAMEKGNSEQCRRLRECYGNKDPECIAEVKEIYREVDVGSAMQEWMQATFLEVEEQITNLPQDDIPCSILFNMLYHYRDVALGIAARP